MVSMLLLDERVNALRRRKRGQQHDPGAHAGPDEERRARMIRMRHSVIDHNIYRWAGLLLSELARIPVETTGAKAS